MLKIRYNTLTLMLSGWEDNEAEFEFLQPRVGETVEILDIEKPDVVDYEYCYYREGELEVIIPNPKRDLAAEINALKERVTLIEQSKVVI